MVRISSCARICRTDCGTLSERWKAITWGQQRQQSTWMALTENGLQARRVLMDEAIDGQVSA